MPDSKSYIQEKAGFEPAFFYAPGIYRLGHVAQACEQKTVCVVGTLLPENFREDED